MDSLRSSDRLGNVTRHSHVRINQQTPIGMSTGGIIRNGYKIARYKVPYITN